MSAVDFDALKREYDQRRTVFDGFCTVLCDQVEKVLAGGITLGSPLQSRVKDWGSILEKIRRLSFSLKRLDDMQDIVGIRIMPLFLRDIGRVRSLIADNFDVFQEYHTGGRLAEDQFGYSSLHMVISIKESWLEVPTLRPYKDMRAEIQIRTLAQHTWAAISQNLQYKNEEGVPPTVRRSIFRASALLETLDLEFDRVLNERNAYKASLEAVEVAGSEDLNVDLLEKLLDEILPEESKVYSEGYSELLRDLRQFKVSTVADLRKLLDKQLEAALAVDAKVVRGEVTGYSRESAGDERLSKGIFLTHVGLVREALTQECGEAFEEYMRNREPDDRD